MPVLSTYVLQIVRLEDCVKCWDSTAFSVIELAPCCGHTLFIVVLEVLILLGERVLKLNNVILTECPYCFPGSGSVMLDVEVIRELQQLKPGKEVQDKSNKYAPVVFSTDDGQPCPHWIQTYCAPKRSPRSPSDYEWGIEIDHWHAMLDETPDGLMAEMLWHVLMETDSAPWIDVKLQHFFEVWTAREPLNNRRCDYVVHGLFVFGKDIPTLAEQLLELAKDNCEQPA